MSRYANAPVGTVFRDRADGTVYVRIPPSDLNTWPFIHIRAEGFGQFNIDGPTDPVELVAHHESLPLLRDGDNEVWIPVYEGAYCRESDVLSRSEVERNVGAVTEEAQ